MEMSVNISVIIGAVRWPTSANNYFLIFKSIFTTIFKTKFKIKFKIDFKNQI